MPTSNTQPRFDAIQLMPELSVTLLPDTEAAAPYLKEDEVYWPTTSDASTFNIGSDWFVAADLGELIANGMVLEDLLALLVHEAYHVAYNHLRHNVGEKTPAEEEVAYHTQAAATSLFFQFFAWLDRQ